MMKNISSLLTSDQKIELKKILKFIVAGGTAALINLVFLYLLVNKLGLKSKIQKNIANALAMEISIIYNFFVNRGWTWDNVSKKYGNNLVKQIFLFHIVVGFSIILRLILFPVLQYFNVKYLFNAGIGIGIGAIINFIFYDKFIFKEYKGSK